MTDFSHLKQRYEQDAPAVQLGGLASNLNRIAWCAQRNEQAQSVPLFRESKYFTEWAAVRCMPEQQELLADVQLQLAIWEHGWGKHIPPAAIAQEAQQWSIKLLEISGLLNQ